MFHCMSKKYFQLHIQPVLMSVWSCAISYSWSCVFIQAVYPELTIKYGWMVLFSNEFCPLKQESGFVFNDFVIIIPHIILHTVYSVTMYEGFMICNKTEKYSSKRWKKRRINRFAMSKTKVYTYISSAKKFGDKMLQSYSYSLISWQIGRFMVWTIQRGFYL